MASSCINVDWDGSWDVFSDKLVRARKEHRCGECDDTIAVGDLHEIASGKWDDSWITHRTCARCCNVRRDYFGSWIYGEMVEAFYEEHGFDYRDGIPPDFAPCRARTPPPNAAVKPPSGTGREP